jgi:hypothetical protein
LNVSHVRILGTLPLQLRKEKIKNFIVCEFGQETSFQRVPAHKTGRSEWMV